jgi:hypothetical protein
MLNTHGIGREEEKKDFPFWGSPLPFSFESRGDKRETAAEEKRGYGGWA